MSADSNRRTAAWFWPLLLVTLVTLVDAAYMSLRLRGDRAELDARFEQQQRTIDDAMRLRSQLESIASDTAQLAEVGNSNAIRLRDHLLQQGVVIRPHSSRDGT